MATMHLRLSGDEAVIAPAMDDLVVDGLDGEPRTLEMAMADTDVAGLAAAVIRDRRVVAELVAGCCPVAGTPIGMDTLFQVGSTSKMVAAFGALVLADDGVVDLDADVGDVLRSWSLPPGGQRDDNPVTIGRLLSHTAGCTVHGFLGYGPHDDVPDLIGVLDGRGNSAKVLVDTPPGHTYSYSGGGYCVVQQAIVDATGEPFDRVMDERVLRPAGERAAFHPRLPGALHVDATAGSIEGRPMQERWRIFPELAAAGLWTSIRDLAAVFVAIGRSVDGLPGALAPVSGPRLVRPAVVADGTTVAHGDGAAVDATTFGHSGRNLGYCSDNEMSLDGSDGVIVVTNGYPGGMAVARAIIDRCRA
jgi:CubicO group peptidase (beta-lactamase class C family)